jgi:hypothetical protein
LTDSEAAPITREELYLATRNHGMPLEALAYPVTPVVRRSFPCGQAGREWRSSIRIGSGSGTERRPTTVTPQLLSAYERLLAGFPQDAFDLHVCVVREGGITVDDTCPSRAVFADFSSSRGVRDAMTKAGLPAPTIRLLDDVHAVRARTADA